MINEKNSIEEANFMVETAVKHNLNISEFASLPALKGEQFGREIYTALVPFKDMLDFLKVFPEVQRGTMRSKIISIKNYVLSGLFDPFNMRFFSAITATARGSLFYDHIGHVLAINTKESRLSINDGQHRFFGIAEALRELRSRWNKEKDKDQRLAISSQIKALESMVIPLTLFNQISEKEEKQLFNDLNLLAKRPSRSSTIKLAQTDIYAVMTREIARENKYFKFMGVEEDKAMIGGDNPNMILLTTIYSCIKTLTKKNAAYGRNGINHTNYDDYKARINETFNKMFEHLPADINEKGKYIFEKSYAFRGVAKFIQHCRDNLRFKDDMIFKTLEKVEWTVDADYWLQFDGHVSATGILTFGSSANYGEQAIFNALMSYYPNSQVTSNQQALELEEPKEEVK